MLMASPRTTEAMPAMVAICQSSHLRAMATLPNACMYPSASIRRRPSLCKMDRRSRSRAGHHTRAGNHATLPFCELLVERLGPFLLREVAGTIFVTHGGH